MRGDLPRMTEGYNAYLLGNCVPPRISHACA